jgi:hypothetical protein
MGFIKKMIGLFFFKPLPQTLIPHYNKRYPCTPSDFTRFWVDSLVVMNGDKWRNNEFTSVVNED